MDRRMVVGAAACGVVAIGCLVGCLKREEIITVKADGGVTIEIEYGGEKGDFEGLDAMPSQAGGWSVHRRTEKDGDKETVTLEGRRTFGPGEELPASYAAPNDPDAGLYLSFPTTLRRERRPDGVYLHFRRVYVPREWAYVQYWADQAVDDNIKKLADKKAEELTGEERVKIIEALGQAEAFKQIEFTQRALRETDASFKPDHWLLARQALMRVYQEQTDWESLAKKFEGLSEEERDQRLERETQAIFDQSRRAFVDSLRKEAKYDDERIGRFQASYERTRKAYEITNQLGAHAFKIGVHMPGTLVAHNGDKVEDGLVVWELDGQAVRDRPYELLVTSRLPLDAEPK